MLIEDCTSLKSIQPSDLEGKDLDELWTLSDSIGKKISDLSKSGVELIGHKATFPMLYADMEPFELETVLKKIETEAETLKAVRDNVILDRIVYLEDTEES